MKFGKSNSVWQQWFMRGFIGCINQLQRTNNERRFIRTLTGLIDLIEREMETFDTADIETLEKEAKRLLDIAAKLRAKLPSPPISQENKGTDNENRLPNANVQSFSEVVKSGSGIMRKFPAPRPPKQTSNNLQ